MTPEQLKSTQAMRDRIRALQIHSARVFLAEAARRRRYNGMHANLLLWAANARKRAMLPDDEPNQPDLFALPSRECK